MKKVGAILIACASKKITKKEYKRIIKMKIKNIISFNNYIYTNNKYSSIRSFK